MSNDVLNYLNNLNSNELESYFCKPKNGFGNFFPADLDKSFLQELKALHNKFKNNLELCKLFELFILTEYLIGSRVNKDTIDMLLYLIDFAALFPNISPDIIFSGRWSSIPVIISDGENLDYRYFITGYINRIPDEFLFPAWARELINNNAEKAISGAVSTIIDFYQISTSKNLLCYPIIKSNGRIKIQAQNIGLAIAISFALLYRDEIFNNNFIAVGGINNYGLISSSRDILDKINFIKENSTFKLFIYPNKDGYFTGANNLEVLSVDDISDAMMFLSLYRKGNSQELILLSKMLKDAFMFVDNCLFIPTDWIKWIKTNNKGEKIAKEILSNSNLFKNLVGQFERAVQYGNLSAAEALSYFIGEETLSNSIEDNAPLPSFKWYSLNLAITSQKRNIVTNQKWSNNISRLVSRGGKINNESFAEYYNEHFITFNHTKYFFEPNIPYFLKKMISNQENVYKNSSDIGSATDKTLGMIYSSISQNFGFCGQHYLPDMLVYSGMSRKAFGDGKNKELRREWRRQFCYMTYAYLDAGQFQLAEEKLKTYLEIQEWQELYAKFLDLTKLQHTTLARFFADIRANSEKKRFLQHAKELIKEMLFFEYPWNIWLYNLGKISISVGKEEQGIKYLNQSLNLCMSGTEPFINVMALLPLSYLHKIGLTINIDLQPLEDKIRTAAFAINPIYFKILEENYFEIALETIMKSPEILFPFSYR